MEKELARFLAVCEDPYRYVAGLKDRGKKIIGCVPLHVPEEMVHAAGMLPVVMWESTRPTGKGHARMQSYFCGLVRGLVDDAVSGRLGFLDGMVLADSCLAVRGIEPVLKRNFPLPYYESLYLPPVLHRPATRKYVISEFERFKSSLERFSGNPVTAGALENSIRLYEEDHGLLRMVYELRRRSPGVITAREMAAIVMSGMIMPKEDHVRLLETLVPALEKRSPGKPGVRLVLSGSLCQAPRVEFLDMCDHAGALVVDDDLYVGSRYFATRTPAGGTPVESLADRYVGQTTPCPTRIQPGSDWGDYLVEMTRKSGARGVINLVVKHCEPHEIYYPHLKRKLADAGIPELLLEIEHETASVAPLKTRVQAFLEMVGGL
ncbi:MAG: 2-hydroxyacyl-CoA dehydratase [Chloroflexi bacterium]|nr:2-hydroxyacyl-CoA dehydratase [Chloroflexota bacterium]